MNAIILLTCHHVEQVGVDADPEYIAAMEPVENRSIKIKFNADTGATMYVYFAPSSALLFPRPWNIVFPCNWAFVPEAKLRY